MGPTGFEPATTRLRAKRSTRLSYGPTEKIFLTKHIKNKIKKDLKKSSSN